MGDRDDCARVPLSPERDAAPQCGVGFALDLLNECSKIMLGLGGISHASSVRCDSRRGSRESEARQPATLGADRVCSAVTRIA
jgi:hypothetical protein